MAIQTRAYAVEEFDQVAVVLECTGFSPFARAIQHAIHIPIFNR